MYFNRKISITLLLGGGVKVINFLILLEKQKKNLRNETNVRKKEREKK